MSVGLNPYFFAFTELLIASPLPAYEFNEQLSTHIVLKEIYQQGRFNGAEGEQTQGRSLTGADLEFVSNLGPTDQFSALMRWARGDALNLYWSGGLVPFAHDGESDLKNIHGSNRDYFLTAYYTHIFALNAQHTLEVNLGLLDSTLWLDENAYAGDELKQFMNDALVHNPVLNLPSYDKGGAVRLQIMEKGHVHAVVMRSKTGDAADASFNYYGLQTGWSSPFGGEGDYRVIIYHTSADFLSPENRFAALRGWGLSFDQSLNDTLGIFMRYGHQVQDAMVDYQRVVSGGVHLKGKFWNRAGDSLGIGYAFLNGGNGEINKSQILEGYLQFELTPQFHLTFDVQWMKEEVVEGSEHQAWIPGVRVIASF